MDAGTTFAVPLRMKSFSRILVVASLALGTFAVAACSGDDDSGTDTVNGKAISEITINGDVTLDKGKTDQESVTVKYADGTSVVGNSIVTWNVDDTSIATVSATGLVTGVGTGTTKVKATYQGKESDSHQIIVH